jgi:hypothetical protein
MARIRAALSRSISHVRKWQLKRKNYRPNRATRDLGSFTMNLLIRALIELGEWLEAILICFAVSIMLSGAAMAFS